MENLPLRAAQDSVYEYLEHEVGLKIGFAMKEITVQMAGDEDRRLLIKNYDMIVEVKSYTYLEDSTLFQFTESRHRPDKFKFVDFARRNVKVDGGRERGLSVGSEEGKRGRSGNKPC